MYDGKDKIESRDKNEKRKKLPVEFIMAGHDL